MITQAIKKNQYDNMFIKGDAISRAPIWYGINKLLNVPDRPAVNTKNTMTVPWMVTKERKKSGLIRPPSAHLPKNTSNIGNSLSGHANWIRNNTDKSIAKTAMMIPVIKNCLAIILWSPEKIYFLMKDSS